MGPKWKYGSYTWSHKMSIPVNILYIYMVILKATKNLNIICDILKNNINKSKWNPKSVHVTHKKGKLETKE